MSGGVEAERVDRVPLERSARTSRVYLGEILNSVATLLYPGHTDAFRRLIDGPFAAARQSQALDADACLGDLVSAQDALRREGNARRKRALKAKMLDAELRYCIACCALAEREMDRGSNHIAWTYLMDAQAVRASLLVKFTVALLGPTTASEAGRKAAVAYHAPDRANRELALAYFKEHKASFEDLDDAAEKISKFVPLQPQTIRNHLKGTGRIAKPVRDKGRNAKIGRK